MAKLLSFSLLRFLIGATILSGVIILTWWFTSRSNGCRYRDEIADFRRKQTAESAQFTDLQPASLRAAMMLIVENNSDASSIAKSVKEKWGNVPEISAYSDRVLKNETAKLTRIQRMVEDLEHDRTNGGVLFDYVWSDGNKEETGLLVLHAGHIVRKIALISRFR